MHSTIPYAILFERAASTRYRLLLVLYIHTLSHFRRQKSISELESGHGYLVLLLFEEAPLLLTVLATHCDLGHRFVRFSAARGVAETFGFD